jgi:hypothetical protein
MNKIINRKGHHGRKGKKGNNFQGFFIDLKTAMLLDEMKS